MFQTRTSSFLALCGVQRLIPVSPVSILPFQQKLHLSTQKNGTETWKLAQSHNQSNALFSTHQHHKSHSKSDAPSDTLPELQLLAPITPEQEHKILTPAARSFLVLLHNTFETRRQELLSRRRQIQKQLDSGAYLPNFLPETLDIRQNRTWKGPPPAKGLIDRRVEITGPVDRKMIINALNTPATQFMADLEDATSPTWRNVLDGQVNLYDAIRGTITFQSPEGQFYHVNELKTKTKPTTLLVRPRGWHLNEAHVKVNDVVMSASLFDFGLYFFHNAAQLISNGFGPYFYLPKLENHLEARLWNDVFNVSQDYLRIPRGTIRATVLIETILAAFEMDEILFELRDHSSGLNCGRWDYIFSFIKKFGKAGMKNNQFLLPDRSAVTMTVPFMSAYVSLLIKTCHRRGVHAMGGMAAQIPIKADATANAAALQKVRDDKLREVRAGHDGTWVAHPDLIPVALEVFNRHMPQSNQMFVAGKEEEVMAEDLVKAPVASPITLGGITGNIQVALIYIGAWLRGQGCLPINYLMEDAATAEIARSQLWQWVHYGVVTTDSGEKVTSELVERIVQEQVRKLSAGMTETNLRSVEKAGGYLLGMIKSEEFVDFLTSYCYDDLVTVQHK